MRAFWFLFVVFLSFFVAGARKKAAWMQGSLPPFYFLRPLQLGRAASRTQDKIVKES